MKTLELNCRAKKAVRAAARVIRTSESVHEEAMKTHVMRAAALGLGGAVLLTLATLCSMRAKESYDAHQRWKQLDAQLDDALAESLDASDSSARF